VTFVKTIMKIGNQKRREMPWGGLRAC